VTHIIEISLSKIIESSDFNVFQQIDFSLIENFKKKYPFIIDIIINKDNELISDYSFFEFHKKKKLNKAKVILFEDDNYNSFFLSYNFRDKFFSINNYEKLLFLNKIINKVKINEIHKNINLGIKISEKLISNLERIIGSSCKSALIKNRISIEACNRIIEFENKNIDLIIKLFNKIKFSFSNQLKTIDFMEEISFKEKISFEKIINKSGIEKILESDNPEKDFMQELFNYRFPLYSNKKKEWDNFIKSLKLPNNFTINHFPFFEKKSIDLNINFKDKEEFFKFVNKFKK